MSSPPASVFPVILYQEARKQQMDETDSQLFHTVSQLNAYHSPQVKLFRLQESELTGCSF